VRRYEPDLTAYRESQVADFCDESYEPSGSMEAGQWKELMPSTHYVEN
jgi:hypothetical protein